MTIEVEVTRNGELEFSLARSGAGDRAVERRAELAVWDDGGVAIANLAESVEVVTGAGEFDAGKDGLAGGLELAGDRASVVKVHLELEQEGRERECDGNRDAKKIGCRVAVVGLRRDDHGWLTVDGMRRWRGKMRAVEITEDPGFKGVVNGVAFL